MGVTMFRIKICGVRQEFDVEDAAAAGADAVGLNFHPPSIRFLPEPRALELAAVANRVGVRTVGVFVGLPVPDIEALAERLDLWAVQLHGDQTVADVDRLRQQGLRVIRAIRLPVGPLTTEQLDQHVSPWLPTGCDLLLDAEVGSDAGGQGMRLDWDSIGRWSRRFAPPAAHPTAAPHADPRLQPDVIPTQTPQVPLVRDIHQSALPDWGLAGGLDPQVVGEAIRRSGAPAVDVASGVEEPRGVKSRSRTFDFVHAAKMAWARRS